jgi:hypothetical protein
MEQGEFKTIVMKRALTVVVILVVIASAAWIRFRPQLTPVASIRTSLLSQTPVGSSREDVRAFAQKQGWIGPTPQMEEYAIIQSHLPEVQVTGFSGWMPDDPFPYRSAVAIRWQFDSSNRLYDIHVTRIPDSPQ